MKLLLSFRYLLAPDVEQCSVESAYTLFELSRGSMINEERTNDYV